MKLVTSTRLIERLQVSQKALGEWHRKGFLVPADTINSVHHYTMQSIDAFLQRQLAKKPRIVAAIDVIAGKVKLLTIEQAAKRLGTSMGALNHRIERGSYPAVRVGGEWRMVETDVNEILSNINNPDYVPLPMTGHILGASAGYLKDRIRDGQLRSVLTSGKPARASITMESILSLVSKLAPPWVDAAAWVAERKEDDRPLMLLSEFERFLGLDKNAGRGVLHRHKVAYLQFARTLIKISPNSAYRLLIDQPELSSKQLADIFGADEATVAKARESREIRCELHLHLGRELKRSCIIEMLRTCLSPGVSATVWCDSHLKNPRVFMSIPETATRYKITEQEVLNRIQNGKLRAVKLPVQGAQWRVERRR